MHSTNMYKLTICIPQITLKKKILCIIYFTFLSLQYGLEKNSKVNPNDII